MVTVNVKHRQGGGSDQSQPQTSPTTAFQSGNGQEISRRRKVADDAAASAAPDLPYPTQRSSSSSSCSSGNGSSASRTDPPVSNSSLTTKLLARAKELPRRRTAMLRIAYVAAFIALFAVFSRSSSNRGIIRTAANDGGVEQLHPSGTFSLGSLLFRRKALVIPGGESSSTAAGLTLAPELSDQGKHSSTVSPTIG